MSDKRSIMKIPMGIWVLGIVSMLMDISSEIIHSLLPLFLTTQFHVSPLFIGILEGVGESTALIIKVFSGVLSDYFGRRKIFTVMGYSIGAISKPLFAIATTSSLIFFARVLDRIGKGLRAAPRDALVADIAPTPLRGSAFGLRQALDALGAVIGPLFALGLMIVFDNHFPSVFWIAVIPAVLCVLLLIFGVYEPKSHQNVIVHFNPLSRTHLYRLGKNYWSLVVIGAIFTLARFSEAFLVLRAVNVGISITFAPIVMVMMSLIYAISAYPIGCLSDRIGRSRLLSLGIFILMIADFFLAENGHWGFILTGASFWGLHMGMTQGVLSAMIADVAPVDLRGTAFGFLNLACGLMMFIASLLAGVVWECLGAASTFYMGAIFCIIALFGLHYRSHILNY